MAQSPDEALASILDMFPEADPDTALECLKSNSGNLEKTITDMLQITGQLGHTPEVEQFQQSPIPEEAIPATGTDRTLSPQEALDAQLAATIQNAELEMARQGATEDEFRYQHSGMLAAPGYPQEDPVAVAARRMADWGERMGQAAKLKFQELTAKCIPRRHRQQLEAEDARMDIEIEEEEEELTHHAQHAQSNASSEAETQLVHRRKPQRSRLQPDSDEAAIRQATKYGDDGL